MLNEYSLDQHVYVFICYNNKYKYISKRWLTVSDQYSKILGKIDICSQEH
jgi:hypothetical protein